MGRVWLKVQRQDELGRMTACRIEIFDSFFMMVIVISCWPVLDILLFCSVTVTSAVSKKALKLDQGTLSDMPPFLTDYNS